MPQLEQLAEARSDHGIRLVDHRGQPYVAGDGFRLYNPLDPQVQAAIADTVQMVVDRYAHHESFGGLCFELGPNTFAQLPGLNWGFDGVTVQRFVRDTPTSQQPKSDQELIASLREGPLRERWLAWRSAQITALYQNVAARLAASRPDARLYLATAKLLEAPVMQEVYQPVLRPRKKLDQALREMGLDLQALAQDERIHISRPYYDLAGSPLLRQASALELAASVETDRRFRAGAQRSAQAFNRHRRVTWTEPTVESAEPAAAKSARVGTSFSGAARRARLIESLAALDAEVLLDGSATGGTAMADQVQRQLRVFSHLPAERFEIVPARAQVESATATSSGPIVVRQLSRADRTTVYAVNVAPWPVQATVRVAAPAGTRLRPVCSACPPSQWQSLEKDYLWEFELAPYDLQAAVISSGQARVTDVATELPVDVGPMLQSKLAELVVRVGQLKDPVPLARLANAGFESVVASTTSTGADFDGWEVSAGEGSSVQPDSTVHRSGKTSMRIYSGGPVTWARSARFAPPKTGRLAVHVWVRNETDQPLPPLRLAIEGRLREQPYYRYAKITEVARPVAGSLAEWQPFVLHVDDLPSLDLEYLQVRFDLMGAGVVWLDDVAVYGMEFTRAEHHELSRIIATADLQLREGRVTECVKSLQRYWPRLLAEQFPVRPEWRPTKKWQRPCRKTSRNHRWRKSANSCPASGGYTNDTSSHRLPYLRKLQCL